jgi:sugar phosphate permease
MFFVFVFVFVLFTPEKFFSNSLQHIEIESRYSKSKKDRTSSFERISKTLKHNTHKSSQHDSVFTIILQTIQNKIFVFGMIVRGLLMGTNTALHYWLNDYIRNALNINDTKSIFYGYTFVNLLSPIIGIFANSAMTYCFGSYENKNASCGLLVFHAITCLFSVSMLTMDALVPFCLCLLMYFIFSSAALPMIQGILISSVPLHAKGTSFGFSNVFATLFISGPAPVVYGIINDHYKDSSKKMGMVFLMGLCCSGLLFIILLHVFRMESIRKEEKEKEVVLYDADDEEKNYRFEQEMESVENDDE